MSEVNLKKQNDETKRTRPNCLTTARLEIVPLTLDEFSLLLTDANAFTRRLRLSAPPKEFDVETANAMNWLYDEALKFDAENLVWTTNWQIILKNENRSIGSACFKGPVDANGNVEIGYGVDDERQNCGYMTEALAAFVDWARTRNDVDGILAESLKNNAASRRVLEKNGFERVRETDDSYFWRIFVGQKR